MYWTTAIDRRTSAESAELTEKSLDGSLQTFIDPARQKVRNGTVTAVPQG